MIIISLDNLIVISLIISICGTCYYYTINKKNDDNPNNDSEPILNKNFAKNEKSFINKSPKSFSDFGVLVDSNNMIPLDDEKKCISRSFGSIQKTNVCSKCHRHLYSYNSMDYFAFDKQYCKTCWYNIDYNLTKKY